MPKRGNLKLLTHQMFYLPDSAQIGDRVEFDRSESRHILASLRATAGDRVRATDGCGNVFLIEIESIKPVASGKILEITKVGNSGFSLSLYQAVLKPNALEMALQMCCELGLGEFVPVITERSIAKISPMRLGRLRKIAIEAMKQSLGAYLTQVTDTLGFKDAIERAKKCDLILFGDTEDRVLSLEEVLIDSSDSGAISIWIGAEGGFSDTEMKHLKAIGAKGFRIGKKRLRSETAAVSAIAICTSWLSRIHRF
ncbi:MAG: RsmE family RNA methyltransferase [bacterium]